MQQKEDIGKLIFNIKKPSLNNLQKLKKNHKNINTEGSRLGKSGKINKTFTIN